MIKDGDTMLLMFREEVEMSTTRCFIDIISLPNSIFQLNNNTLHYQSYSDVDLNTHLIFQPQK